jgi:hypothetical protein
MPQGVVRKKMYADKFRRTWGDQTPMQSTYTKLMSKAADLGDPNDVASVLRNTPKTDYEKRIKILRSYIAKMTKNKH